MWFNFTSCFIGDLAVLLGAFLLPILVVLLFNSVVFVTVIGVMLKQSISKYKNNQVTKSIKRLLVSTFGIMFLFGMSWVFGALTISEASETFQYLFTIFTSLQGFFIFIFFCVLGKEARRLWINLLCCRCKLPWITSSTSSSIQQKSGGTRTNEVFTSSHRPLSSVYLRSSSDTSLQSFVSQRPSDTPSIGSDISIDVNPINGAVSHLHAIKEENEEDETSAAPGIQRTPDQ